MPRNWSHKDAMNQFQNLFLTALVASPTNPRKTFDPVKLKELATSIAASGVHQAILVRQLPAQRLLDTAHIKPRPEYEIVAGERRYRASVIAKADTIPAIIREASDKDVLEIYASYHRELFVGKKPAILAIDLYKKAYLGGNRPVAEVNKLLRRGLEP